MKGISSTFISLLGFPKIGTASIAESVFPCLSWAAPLPLHGKRHELFLFSVNTRETIRTCNRADVKLDACAIERTNHTMRDHRTGESKSVDPNLLDLRYCISAHVAPHAPISIVSGGHSPRTNEALRKLTTGETVNSMKEAAHK